MNDQNLIVANQRRQANAAAATIERARKAFILVLPNPSVDWDEYQRVVEYRNILRARIIHPGDTLAELAARLDMTKDAYAGLLRRALTYGETQQ